jgi:hypothetical protein
VACLEAELAGNLGDGTEVAGHKTCHRSG